MSKPQMEMSCDLTPSHGVWGWNDEHQSLEFISLDTPADVKERRKKCKLLSSQDTVSKRPERSAQMSAASGKGQPRVRSPTDKNAVGEAQLNAYKTSPKRDQRDCVTIEDIKQATLILLQEKESIPLGFLPILKQRELDDFLASLLLYLSCFFVKTTLEKKTTPHMMEQSLREQQEMAEACMKVDLSLKQLAIHYSTLLLELTLPLLSAAKGKTSAKHKEVFECLYRFLCYGAWVAFERKDLSAIQEEVGRLLYSDTFNPACKLRAKQGVSSPGVSAQKSGEAESKDPACPPVPKSSRNCPRRLDLTKVLTQRTPLMEALLPPTGQAAPHLFAGFSPQKERSLIVCDREVLLDQLTDQLASLSFGILGKPLSLFSGPTLIRRGEEDKDEDEEEEKGENAKHSSSADMHSKQGRTNTAVSRATTEGGYSDTE